MKPYILNSINAITYISLGSWGYFSSDTPSVTALIPVFIGIVLIFLTKGLKNENKVLAHIAVVLTILAFGGLFKPLFSSFGRHDDMAIFRVIVMLITSILALVSFVNSFIQARKK